MITHALDAIDVVQSQKTHTASYILQRDNRQVFVGHSERIQLLIVS